MNRGASLLETLFAIAIVMLAIPFAYRQLSNVRENIQTVSVAKQLVADADPIKNYMNLHADEILPNELTITTMDDENKSVYFIKNEDGIMAFLVMGTSGNIMMSHKIANLIGMDAAVTEDDGVAYSASGGWSIQLPDTNPGDIVFMISSKDSANNSQRYLHRTALADDELSTMKRTLDMGGFSINEISDLDAVKLTSSNLDANLATIPVVTTNALYFPNGVNLNPQKSVIPTISVSGDVVNAKNIFTDYFEGKEVIANQVKIAKKLSVANILTVKSLSGITVSDFAGMSLNQVRTTFLSTTNMTFLTGFGLIVSSELLYSGISPITFGNWSFADATGPKFSSLILRNFGKETLLQKIPDFSKILDAGWK